MMIPDSVTVSFALHDLAKQGRQILIEQDACGPGIRTLQVFHALGLPNYYKVQSLT